MIRSEVVEKKEEKQEKPFPKLVETNNSIILFFSESDAVCLHKKSGYGFPLGRLTSDPKYILQWDETHNFTGTIQLSNE